MSAGAGQTAGRLVLLVGAVLALAAVALGAAGAHLLENVPEGAKQTFSTGVRYQMWHALALLVMGVLSQLDPANHRFRWAAMLMTLGVLMFSGALYALVLVQWPGFSWMAPLGGISLLLGWLALIWSVLKRE